MSFNPKKWFSDLFSVNTDFSSLPVKKQKEIFKKHSISEFIRPISTSQRNIICNDGYFGFVYECVPNIRGGTKTAETIETICKKL